VAKAPELKNTRVLLVTGIRKEKKITYEIEPDQAWLPVRKILEKPVLPEVILAEVRNALA
jgi:hypothetical protein